MPLQRYDTAAVPRPSGLVPPVADLTGVTELRLHGVGGTTPENLLGDVAPQLVSGDRIAGFYRTADLPGRHVEAYSWGGLTSRSGVRVLWLLLFPFALANVAGWMCSARTHDSPARFRLHRAAVRWAALGLTLNLLLIAAMTGMELLGYQCGGQPACADDTWPLRLLHGPLVAGHPARRILAGAVVPLALVLLLAVLALRTIIRYEATSPHPPAARPAQPSAGAARARVGLADPTFWDGQRAALDLGYLHIAAGCGFVALAIAHTVRESARLAGAPVAVPLLWPAVLVLGGLVLLGAVVFVALERCPAAVPGLLLGLAGGAVCLAGWFAVAQPGYVQPFGYLPGMRPVANLTLGAVFGALLLVLVATLPGGWRRGTFQVFGPFVTLTLSVLALNVVLVSVMSRVAALTAEVSTRVHLPAGPPDRVELYVYPIIGKLVHYLTVVPLALVLLFTAYELVSYWRAGADRAERERIRRWYREHVPRPADEDAWWQSTVAEERVERQWLLRMWRTMLGAGWEARIARARRFARMPRDVDKLLTAMAVTGMVLLVGESRCATPCALAAPGAPERCPHLGSYLASGIPFLLILVLRRGWRDLHSRRRIGVLWDILTFWPRAYHPLAPPSYPERAVPELQQRLWRIHDSGGRVVLAAHSQGTVLAAAALLQPEHRPGDDVVALVTFGSPLTTLYGWAFPAYFGAPVLRRLAPTGENPATAVHAWRNFHYRTDYIGGAVFGAAEPSGVDEELPDPGTSWYVHGQSAPAATRHSGYWVDPAVWRAVDEYAEAVAAAGRIPRQGEAAVRPAR
ncbi:hypothetical protein [Plantactinospora sp. CA-290183]|uniref:hypothetical protein n=1 Tax=Plantactinospora sp. CA-290183 TaxID=3240006 RepID=UPI003D93707F